MSLHWQIIRTLARHPFRVFITDDTRSYRGIDLLIGSLHIASEIARKCSSPTVGIMLPTGGAFPMAALASWMLGKTVVPLNFLLKPEELAYVIQDCDTDTVITAGPMLKFVGQRPAVPNVIGLDPLSFKGFPEPRWPVLAADEDLALLLYTSGTSGRPKGVMLSHGNIAINIRQAVDWVGFTSEEVICGVLPQFHTFGLTVLTLLPLTIGCKVVYTARFVPHRIIKLIREHRPTALVAIPSMFNALLHVKDGGPADFESFRYIVSGGEPLPRAVAEAFAKRFGKIIGEGYGLTETSPITNWCRPEEFRPGSVGPPLEWIEERIVDLIEAHRSSIVFANSRRLAERLTSRLNEKLFPHR